MSLYYIDNLYKDIDYKALIDVMFEEADSFYLRVSRSRIGDKYNEGREENLKRASELETDPIYLYSVPDVAIKMS